MNNQDKRRMLTLVVRIENPEKSEWLPRWNTWEYCLGIVNTFDYTVDSTPEINITYWTPLPEKPNAT
jgi:hypothetical protein